MTWRNGLYEQNPDVTYEAADDRFLIKTLFTEGVINLATGGGLVVQRQAGAAMEVYVPPLDCIIDGDDVAGQNSYLCRMTVGESVPVVAASTTNPRIDLLIAEFTDRQYKTPTATQPGGPHLRLVQGTPAASPVAPSITTLPTAIPLAAIAVAANATSITNANITDLRTQAGAATLKVGTQFVSMTTAQRDALTAPFVGQSIFNSTMQKNETYLGSTLGWQAGARVDVQTFPASGTWTKPAGAALVLADVAGAGGAGGGLGPGNQGYYGGGPGAGGARAARLFAAAGLPATVPVVVGAAGVSALGAAGTAGGQSSFGNLITAGGGNGGLTGSSSVPATVGGVSQGDVGPIEERGGSVNSSATGLGRAFKGGAGGGYTNPSNNSTGTDGRAGDSPIAALTALGGAGGTQASRVGQPGLNGSAGVSGGGGGSGASVPYAAGAAPAGVGGNGGAGGIPGGGGGGGGNGFNDTNTSTRGGAGGRGEVTVTTICI